MKVAVILYGHLRDFEVCADSLHEHLFNKYECDVFIHTWDVKDHNSKCWHEQRFEALKVDEQVIDLVNKKYHPQGLIVEHQEKYEKEKIITPAYVTTPMSTAIPHYMFYSMNKANELRKVYEKENGVKYDYVFVTRPDIRLKTDFDLSYYLNEIKVLGLNEDACRFYAPFEDTSLGGINIARSNDLLFFAKPEVINKYISVNCNLSDDDFQKYGLTILTILTAKEIRVGIIPIPLTYSMSTDWDYSSLRVKNIKRTTPRWKLAIFRIGAIILYPIFRLQKKYRKLNYFELKESL